MAPIASRFFAASALFASTVGQSLNTCALQGPCIAWEMTPAQDECPANPVINPNSKQCPGRWKVCMTITQNIDGKAPGCPAAVVSGRCPSGSCATGLNTLQQQNLWQCTNPWPIAANDANVRKYCQFGQPGKTLYFKVMDGAAPGEDCTGPDGPATARFMTNQQQCRASVTCKAGGINSDKCDDGCRLKARPCVHEFLVPDDCGCTDTTTSSSTTSSSTTTASSSTTQQKPGPVTKPINVGPNAIESMPNKPQGLLFGGLAESRVSGLASPAVLVAGSALAVATVAAAVVAMARRGAAGAGYVQATGEVEEAFLPEQLEG